MPPRRESRHGPGNPLLEARNEPAGMSIKRICPRKLAAKYQSTRNFAREITAYSDAAPPV
jgi:hypothetical protein